MAFLVCLMLTEHSRRGFFDRRGALLRFSAGLLVLAGISLFRSPMSHAQNPSPDEIPWGPAAGDLQIRIIPEKASFTPADPWALRLQVRNLGREELRLQLARVQDNGTSVTLLPGQLKLTLTDDSGTTFAYYSRLFEDADLYKSQARDRLATDRNLLDLRLPPDGSVQETRVYMESGFDYLRHGRALDKKGAFTVEARLGSWLLAGRNQVPLSSDPLRNPDEYLSNPCTVAIASHDAATSATWHDSLSWWESMTLTLFDDGRFLFNCFSDAGGWRPPVKGRWQETSGVLVLDGAVNRDVHEFRRHHVWKRAQAGRWPVLMPPEAADELEAGGYPTGYPALSPGPPENPPSRGMRPRPWDAETSNAVRRRKSPGPAGKSGGK